MNYNYIKVPVLSVIVAREHLFALVRRGNMLSVVMIDEELRTKREVTTLDASKGFILDISEDKLLLSVDNKLVLIENGEQRTVLKSRRSENFFWHIARAKNKVFVQEYGEVPTGIFASEDLKNWRRLVINTDLDKHSRHFHDIAYDPYRKWLIVTLGDGCLTKVVYSKDLGETWGSLYRGPWQFVPMEVLRDRIVFGMDSGIVRGGIGVYYPDSNCWDFTFLRWYDRKVRLAQMCDLRQLDNGIWIAVFGTPQAVMVSRDLKMWYAAYIEGFNKPFNHNMSIAEGKEFVICSTGKSLLKFDKRELEKLMQNAQPSLSSYTAYIDRLRGFGFILKRKLFTDLFHV